MRSGPGTTPGPDFTSGSGHPLLPATGPLQQPLQEAPAGEARLEQVRSDERREQEPVRAHPIAQGERSQHEYSGEAAYQIVDLHNSSSVSSVNVRSPSAEPRASRSRRSSSASPATCAVGMTVK